MQALQFHNQAFNGQLFELIFFPAYMVIAGENEMIYKMLDETCNQTYVTAANDTYTQNDCPDYVGKKVALFFFTIYILLLVTLAINLLIAIFNNTYDEVNKDAKRIWASQRYKELIDEYIDRPILPPPFHLLSFIFNGFIGLIEYIQNRNRKTHPSSEQVKSNFFSQLLKQSNQKYSKIRNYSEREELIEWYENMAQEFFCQYSENW